MATFIRLFLLILVIQHVRSSLDDEEEQLRVAEILNEVAAKMRAKENIIRPPMMDSSEAMIRAASLPENDMILSVKQAQMILDALDEEMGEPKAEPTIAKRISSETIKWTFPIKYAFDGTHNDNEKATIRKGISFWEATTCVRFKEYSSTSQIANSYGIYFSKGNGCNSAVGRSYSPQMQRVSLGDGCNDHGIAAHELGHALGLYHEHMRADRDNYINLNLANVISGWEFAFAKVSANDDNNYGCPYDFSSVMHYDSLGFSSDYWGKKRVMTTKDPMYLTSLGQREYVSFLDAKRINYFYNCMALACGSTRLTQPCQNGGYQDPNNCVKCRCPEGFGGDFCQTFAPASANARCGGQITMQACSSTIISSASYPSAYPARSSCAWSIEAPAGSSLVFGFENQPQMPCTSGDTCEDYVEIRTSTDPTYSGPKFCKCGVSSGRITVDRNKVIVWFISYSSDSSKGFRLNVYATCNGTKASSLTKECLISKSGYDYAGTRSTTDSGKSCNVWAGQNGLDGLDFPGGTLAAAGRTCRNPDSRSSPWCYTGSGYSSSDYCTAIPQCPTGNSQPIVIPQTTPAPPPVTTPRRAPTTTLPRTTTRRRSNGGASIPSYPCRSTQEGREYTGFVSRTKSGIPCQKWTDRWPHKSQFTDDSLFPDGSVAAAGSYCRNPDPNFTDGVWCYTQDPFVVREICEVPMCKNSKRLWRKIMGEYLENRLDGDYEEPSYDDAE